MATETLSASITVPASPDVVFAVLADPPSHAAIDDSDSSTRRTGWVGKAVDIEPLTRSGQVFRMGMYHPNHPDGHYVTANQVREFDPPRTISWATGTEDADGVLSFGGWVWRYDLTATADDATELRLTYDWSGATAEARKVINFPPFDVEHLQTSLRRLAELATS